MTAGDFAAEQLTTALGAHEHFIDPTAMGAQLKGADTGLPPKSTASYKNKQPEWRAKYIEKMATLSSFLKHWSAQVVDHKTLGKCYRIDLESEDGTSSDPTKDWQPLSFWVNRGHDPEVIRTKFHRKVFPCLGECYRIDAAALNRQFAAGVRPLSPPAAKKAKLFLECEEVDKNKAFAEKVDKVFELLQPKLAALFPECEESNKNKAFAEKLHKLQELLHQSLGCLCSVAQDSSMLAGRVVDADDIGLRLWLPNSLPEQASDWIDGDGWALPNVEIVKGLVAKAKESEKLLVRIAAMTGKRAARDAD